MESKTPMSKKNIVGAAVALALAAYGGATWYMGKAAHQHYEEALAEAKNFLGPQAVVSHEYQRGFWTSDAKLVLQWSPHALADADDAGDAGDASAPAAMRITVDSHLRHGPLAGARLAAAVVESHFSTEGLDEHARQMLAKVSPPTLNTVHHLMGGYDIHFALPAGEMGDGDQLLRWQELTYQMGIDAARRHVNGSFKWPAMDLSGRQNTAAEQDDEDEEADDSVAEHFTLALQGMEGDFKAQIEDGLWMLAPGSGKGKFDKVVMTRTQGDAAAQTLLALQDLRYFAAIERTGNTLGWTTKAQSQGSIGPLVFDDLGWEETVSRIDIEAAKLFQKALLAAYYADPAQAALLEDAQGDALWKEAAPLFVAALPAYAMKLSAALEGQQATLEYGAQIQTAPTAGAVQERGWGPALLQGSVLHAGMRLPKAWLPRMAVAVGQEEMADDQIDAVLGMAQAQGLVQQEDDHLVGAVRMEGGQLQLNGKALDLPMFRLTH